MVCVAHYYGKRSVQLQKNSSSAQPMHARAKIYNFMRAPHRKLLESNKSVASLESSRPKRKSSFTVFFFLFAFRRNKIYHFLPTNCETVANALGKLFYCTFLACSVDWTTDTMVLHAWPQRFNELLVLQLHRSEYLVRSVRSFSIGSSTALQSHEPKGGYKIQNL